MDRFHQLGPCRVALLLLTVLAGCDPSPAKVQSRGEFTGNVVKVIDGDTLDVLHSGTITTRIRLNGIDAPERKQPFSAKSKQRLSELIGTGPIRVVDCGKDQYGRTIGDVYSGDKLLNLAMVRDGMAWHFKRYSSDPKLASAKIEARAAKRGLWADPKPVAPRD
jgi:endonuclease YncB( thermonuclease family)